MKQSHREWSVVASYSILIASLSLSSLPLTAQSSKSSSARLCRGCRLTSIEPASRSSFEATQKFHLKSAHTAAMRKLSTRARCGELFQSFELDGASALESLDYRPPQSTGEQEVCDTGVTAFTAMGKKQVVLCRTFHQLPHRSQAAILIHEALHTAGLGEAPNDPDGMTSLEITRMVKRACSL